MKTPMFSIIVPIYNIDNYLDKCIQSILSQTYTDFELILVDDGSKDSSPRICDNYANADNRIKVIHKPNGGLVSARKAGAEIAIGNYIVCVDGDDWILENYLEKFSTVIEAHSPSMICCNYLMGTEDSLFPQNFLAIERLYTRPEIERELFPNLIYSEKKRLISPNVWSKAFERSLYTKIQLSVPDEISLGEDAAVTFPYTTKSNTIYTIPEALYCYRYNPTSITKSKKPFSWDKLILRCENLESQIDTTLSTFSQQLNQSICHSLFNVTGKKNTGLSQKK